MSAASPQTENVFLVRLDGEKGERSRSPRVPPTNAESGPKPLFQQVAEVYQDWLDQGHNPDRELFPTPASPGNPLEQNAVFLARQMSIFGLKPVEGQTITEQTILDELRKRREELTVESKRFAQILLAHQLFTESTTGTGLVLPERFALDKFYFVSPEKIAGQKNDPDCLALTLPTGEVLVPSNITVEEILDVTINEFGHQTRFSSKKDDRSTGGDWALEEGIIQSHTETVERTKNLTCERTGNIYVSETWFAGKLGLVLGVGDLIGVGQDEIRRTVNEKYANKGIIGEPFDEMMNDLFELRKTERSVTEKLNDPNLTPDQEARLRQEYHDRRNQIAQMWQFSQNTTSPN